MNVLKQLLVRGVWFSAGGSVLWLVNQGFDWVLFPFVICKTGIVVGGILMATLSVPFNFFLIQIYDILGLDLFALEAVKRAQENIPVKKTWYQKIFVGSKWPTFVLMSMWDPIPAVIYIRDGHGKFNSLDKRSWSLFVLATLISNGLWVFLIAGGITALGSIEDQLNPILEFLGVSKGMIGACVPLF